MCLAFRHVYMRLPSSHCCRIEIVQVQLNSHNFIPACQLDFGSDFRDICGGFCTEVYWNHIWSHQKYYRNYFWESVRRRKVGVAPIRLVPLPAIATDLACDLTYQCESRLRHIQCFFCPKKLLSCAAAGERNPYLLLQGGRCIVTCYMLHP